MHIRRLGHKAVLPIEELELVRRVQRRATDDRVGPLIDIQVALVLVHFGLVLVYHLHGKDVDFHLVLGSWTQDLGPLVLPFGQLERLLIRFVLFFAAFVESVSYLESLPGSPVHRWGIGRTILYREYLVDARPLLRHGNRHRPLGDVLHDVLMTHVVREQLRIFAHLVREVMGREVLQYSLAILVDVADVLEEFAIGVGALLVEEALWLQLVEVLEGAVDAFFAIFASAGVLPFTAVFCHSISIDVAFRCSYRSSSCHFPLPGSLSLRKCVPIGSLVVLVSVEFYAEFAGAYLLYERNTIGPRRKLYLEHVSIVGVLHALHLDRRLGLLSWRCLLQDGGRLVAARHR